MVKNFSHLLEDADALLVVPPFSAHIMPSIGVHILQSYARRNGFNVRILYMNIAMASEIGERIYLSCCTDGIPWESTFAEAAYGVRFARKKFVDGYQELFKRVKPEDHKRMWAISEDPREVLNKILYFQENFDQWVDQFAGSIVNHKFKVIGCSTCFQQTAAGIALLKKIKEKTPDTITIMGGSNCFGEMSKGILSLCKDLDFVFSGESEGPFTDFLSRVTTNTLPGEHIIKGEPVHDLDELPAPDYSDYYQQLDFFFENNSMVKKHYMMMLPYETSRGCWWGQKKQCTFCGLNGETLKYRKKSPGKVITELKMLLQGHPTRKVGMTDNIMPYSYFETFFPKVIKELPDIDLGYEIKQLVTLEQLLLLKKAGVSQLQPGIESLSTSLLNRMNKGCKAHHNVTFLKNTTSLNIQTNWNILWGFPGDTKDEYEEILKRVKLVKHFWPPNFTQMNIARFSDYFLYPEKYGIRNLRPLDVYKFYLPPTAEIENIAYDFRGEFACFSLQGHQLIEDLAGEIKDWRGLWQMNKQPKLHISRIEKNKFCILDTRNLHDTKERHFIDREQAITATVDRPVNKSKPFETDWACEQKLGLILDGRYISLITAAPELLLELKQDYLQHKMTEKEMQNA